jgi:hypothetical protein
VCERERVRGGASERGVVLLIFCVCPDHACLSLGQEACSVHKQVLQQGVMYAHRAVLGALGDPLHSCREACGAPPQPATATLMSRPGSPLRSGAQGLARASFLAPSRLLLSSSFGRWRKCDHSMLSHRLRLCARDSKGTKTRGAAHETRASCAPPTSKARHRASPAAPSVRETITTEGGKSAKEGKAIEDKGKGNAEEGQDSY